MKNLKISRRLGLGFGIVILLLGIIVTISVIRMNGAEKHVHNILDDRYKKIALMSQVRYNVALIHQHMRGAVIEGDAEGVKKETEAMNALRAKNTELFDTFDKVINVPKAREIFNEIIKARTHDLAMQKELLALLAAGNLQEARNFLNTKVVEAEQAYVKRMAEMIDLQTQKMDEEATNIRSEFTESRIVILIVAIVALSFSVFAAGYVTRSITVPMNTAVEVARRVAEGDLTANVEVRSRDETGQLLQALKNMNDSLARIVGEVRGGSETIASASGQIASGTADLSSRTEEQAGSLEETASSMEELTSTVKQNADNARQANQLAVNASEVAVKGGAVVSEVVHTMGSINESARKIVDIIGVIDGIAFQTNILALNAAVEAARAGEQGRGFAVVASEVRNLAQRSAAAAKEIKVLIDNSVEKVDAGSKLVDQAGTTMQEVVESIRRVTDIMAEISAASQEQTAGIEQVNQAIVQMDQMTQQNAALVEESAAASEAMREQASRLTEVVGVFKINGTAGMPSSRSNVVSLATTQALATPSTANPLQAMRLASAGSARSGDWDEF